jgi:hypothetical protein
MREANASAERHAVYSVFFDDEKYMGVRQSVLIEGCETQVFSLAELGNSPVSPADGQPRAPGRRKQTHPSD